MFILYDKSDFYTVNLPSPPYTATLVVDDSTHRTYLKNFKCILSISFDCVIPIISQP